MEVTSLCGCVILGDLSGILNFVVVVVSPSLFQKSGNNEFTTLFAYAAGEEKKLLGSNFAVGWKSESAVSST